jgi:muramoyltetrapeptide carboxypeptidase LdcA involved in peptidoglycan recycling
MIASRSKPHDPAVATQITSTKPALSHLPSWPIDFGHTTPIITFPIGGSLEALVDTSDP